MITIYWLQMYWWQFLTDEKWFYQLPVWTVEEAEYEEREQIAAERERRKCTQ